MNHGNIRIEDGRAVVTKPFAVLSGVIATAAYGFVLFALFESGFVIRNVSLPLVIVFLVSTAAWVWYMAGRKIVTTFEAAEGRVYRRNFLYTTAVIDFSDIAGVFEMSESGDGGTSVYFRISLKSDEYGKGYRLTRSYAPTDDEAVYMKRTGLEALNVMIAGASQAGGGDGGPADAAGIPLTLVAYARTGNRFARTSWLGVGVFLLVGLVVIGRGLVVRDWGSVLYRGCPDGGDADPCFPGRSGH